MTHLLHLSPGLGEEHEQKPGRVEQAGITNPVRLLESKGGDLESGEGQIIEGPMGQIKEFSAWSRSDREPLKNSKSAMTRSDSHRLSRFLWH